MSWNKGRLAYTPLGPYIAKRYREGASYGKIAKEVGIYKGCVQNLCRVIGVPSRENHTTNIADVWEQRLSDYVARTGAEVIGRPERLTKKSRILTECSHGISERPCQVLEGMTFCCKSGSKSGLNNPGEGWGVRSKYRCLPGVLYLVRYLDESGTHFKLGITRRTLRQRLGDSLVSIIHLHHATYGECYDLEQDCFRHCKQQGWRYASPTTTELIHPDGLPYLLDRLTPLSLP
jgi:hypothetical protein